MHRQISRRSIRVRALGAALFFMGSAGLAGAQTAEGTGSLRQAFDAAWARQPEAATLQTRRDAAAAQGRAAQAWTPEAPALELSNRSDRWHDNQGVRELEAGVSVPLWLPGERGRSGALADAGARAVESRADAARLRVAEALRETHWAWQRSAVDAAVASDQQSAARRLADDVARRLKAGDLARSDQHQAEGAVAAADAALAQALAARTLAEQRWRAVVGPAFTAPVTDDAAPAMEPEPVAPPADAHPALRDLQDRAAVADRAAALAALRTRANPELLLATTRERDGRGEPTLRTITLGIRIPFGAGDRQAAVAATARAEATELDVERALAADRLAGEADAARAQVDAAKVQLAAAERRAQLAAESRGFFDRSFRLGETDLPTRLRIEAEAAEAQRQAARSRIDLGAAISHWRQALGLLPE
ncbi:TolC family protein [Variovorax sp. LT2P21]|uniref:TolC family protein n=1 Tax=Variovorax sp. LT2P21 TaxID=3443731 RepID=UPI003F47F592